MRKTLIYHYGGLGDFLCTLPFIYLWKKRTGNGIVLLGKPEQSKLVSGSGLIEESLDVNSSRFLPLFTDKAIDNQDFINSFEHIVLFSSEESCLLQNIRKFYTGTAIHQLPNSVQGQHIIDYHLSLLLETPIDKRAIFDSIIKIPPEYEKIRDHLLKTDKRYITIHPGSGSARKNWPLCNFREISVFLKSKGFGIVWICGPAEGNIIVPENEFIVNSSDILLAAAFLKTSSLHLDNDSGIAHLASAVDCPSIVLFGSSNPQVWKPFSAEIIVSKSNCPYLPCHPGPVRECKQECMEDISVPTVIEKIEKVCTYSVY
jgi:heptosyltransferase-3